MERNETTAYDLGTLISSGTIPPLIDVRTPAEYQAVHVRGAVNIPLDEITKERVISTFGVNASSTIYVICQSGARGREACARMDKAGLVGMSNIIGGTAECIKLNLPLVRGKSTISLERQVRIAAGSLVLIGVLLGISISSLFLLLSGFVGAGLIFAGVTDTCGMALLLTRMPWNQSARKE